MFPIPNKYQIMPLQPERDKSTLYVTTAVEEAELQKK